MLKEPLDDPLLFTRRVQPRGSYCAARADMKFDLMKVDLKTHKLENGRSFTEINPKGYVPALQFDDGEVLTENIAILSLIADRYPALMAPGQFGRHRLLEMLAYIST